MKKTLALLCAAALLFCFTTGCIGNVTDQTNANSMSGFAFNTVVYAEVRDGKLKNETKEKIEKKLSYLEKVFSADAGYLSVISSAKENDFVNVSYDLYELLKKAKLCYGVTDGKFDPTVFPLVKLWQFYPNYPVKDFTPPSASDIEKELEKTGFNEIVLESRDDGYYVIKDKADVSLDLGGTAKGYAADEIAKILTDDGYADGYVSIGSSSLRLLSVPELGVRHPQKSGEQLLKINCENLKNVSVSTSGNYEKYYEYDGKRYCHIIDPQTGYPSQTGVLSVTVICDDGAVADCLSTALCLYSIDENDLDKSELVKYIEKFTAENSIKNCIVFAATDDGKEKQLFTNADEKSFTLLDKDFSVITLD